MTPWQIHDGLAVYRTGEGEPIFLMPAPHRFERPGLRSADELTAALQAVHQQLITYDPPGSGLSTRRANRGLLEMLDCADEALRTAGVEGPIDAVGHSMAGLVTLAYALERPSRIKRLVLVGTGTGGPAYTNAPGALCNRTHPRFWAMARLSILHLVWPARGPERLLNNLIHVESFFDRSQADPNPVAFADWFRPREGWTGWHWQARKLDYSGRIGEIKIPCLILCGRHDPQYPLTCSKQLAAGIAGASLVIYERSGHYPYIEERARFEAAVESFLTERGPSLRPPLDGERTTGNGQLEVEMVSVEGDIAIERPLEEVFDFVADESNEPKYNPRMTQADKITAGPIGAGTRFNSVMTGMGGAAEMTIEFTEFDRPRRIVEKVHLSSMGISGLLLFEPISIGTRMKWVWDLEPHGFMRLLRPVLRRLGERQEREIWTGLKRFMESRPRTA